MVRGLKVEVNSRMVSVIDGSQMRALSSKKRSLDELQMLEYHFKNVHVARCGNRLKEVKGEDKFKVWKYEFSEVAGPWTADLEALQTRVLSVLRSGDAEGLNGLDLLIRIRSSWTQRDEYQL